MAQRYYSPVTIDHTKVPSTQTNFPVLVSLTDNRFKTIANGGHVNNSSGFDIRPYSDSGLTTTLTYELERYTASTGELIMWVKIASLSSATDTVIYLGYGDTALISDGSSSSTWDSNFVGVYHLKNGTTLSLTDSSTAGNNGTGSGTPTATTGQINGGIHLVSASSQSVDLGNGINPIALTYSSWLKIASLPAINFSYTVLSRNDDNINYTQLLVTRQGSNSFLNINPDMSTPTDVSFFGTVSLNTGTWYMVTVTYDSTNGMKGYVNGSADGSAAAAGDLTTTAGHTYMSLDFASGPRYMDGDMDEVRISNTARSADWILTEYRNQNSPSTFETLGTEAFTARRLSALGVG